MAKHTPGPWFVSSMNDALFITDKAPPGDGGKSLARVKIGVDTAEQDEANAYLMAASPRMLEALKELRNAFMIVSGDDWQHPAYRKACDAIAEGEGR